MEDTMSRYTTQMDAAIKGIITPEMEQVSAYENMDVEQLRELVAKGQIVIPANINHKSLKPYGIGTRLKTKINVNLGTAGTVLTLMWKCRKYRRPLIWERKRLWT